MNDYITEPLRSAIVKGGLFEVYENGDIFRIINGKRKKSALCKTSRDGRYYNVSTVVEGKQKHFYAHRLIAEAFIPNPYNKSQVNHIDGDGRNNSIDNLEWVTPRENIKHFYKNNNNYEKIRSLDIKYDIRLTRDQRIAFILLKEGLSIKEIALHLNVTENAVYKRIDKIKIAFKDLLV